ncbi:hypothetical protein [Streptomyces sp. SYSU K21746]
MSRGYESDWAAAERLAQGEPVPAVIDITDAAAWTGLDLEVRVLADHRPALLPSRRLFEERLRWPTLHRHSRPVGESVLALALCHPDGRVREAALDRAADTFPGLLPLVVIRCADWAAPVRERARTLLADLLPTAGPDISTLATLVLRVASRRHGGFAHELLDRMLREGPPEGVEGLLVSEDRATRRFAHRIAVRRQLLSPARLARTAADDGDVVIQDLCAEAALAAVRDGAREADGAYDEYDEDGAYEAVLGPLLGSRHPRVRSAGVTALRRAGRAAQAEPFLVDRSGVVRACARWVLRQHGTDPQPLYRALCADPAARSLPPGAPVGLAECGTRADAALLVPLLAHPVGAVRARAVAGLRLLDAADAELLRPLLDDPAPAVARETAMALLPSVDRLAEEWLARRLLPDRPSHNRRAAFRLLRVKGPVAQLRAAVSLLSDDDPRLSALARPAVQQWVPTGAVPRGDAEVAALLDRCSHLFSDDVLRQLRWRAGITS